MGVGEVDFDDAVGDCGDGDAVGGDGGGAGRIELGEDVGAGGEFGECVAAIAGCVGFGDGFALDVFEGDADGGEGNFVGFGQAVAVEIVPDEAEDEAIPRGGGEDGCSGGKYLQGQAAADDVWGGFGDDVGNGRGGTTGDRGSGCNGPGGSDGGRGCDGGLGLNGVGEFFEAGSEGVEALGGAVEAFDLGVDNGKLMLDGGVLFGQGDEVITHGIEIIGEDVEVLVDGLHLDDELVHLGCGVLDSAVEVRDRGVLLLHLGGECVDVAVQGDDGFVAAKVEGAVDEVDGEEGKEGAEQGGEQEQGELAHAAP